MALTVNDLHSLTIHCPLNVKGILHKESFNDLLPSYIYNTIQLNIQY
jgi:hypothetical protein